MKLFTILLLLSAWSCQAQTVTTNWVTAAPNFREVNGKLYNIEKSTNWQKINVSLENLDGTNYTGWFLKGKSRRVYDGSSTTGNYLASGNGYHWAFDGWQQDHKVCVQNAPLIPVGLETNLIVMKTGISPEGLELWDFGIPHRVAVLKTNSIAL